jgi:hypothetical protein
MALNFACLGGHLHVVKWLDSISGAFKYTYGKLGAFRAACMGGHLPTVQWLHLCFGSMVLRDGTIALEMQWALDDTRAPSCNFFVDACQNGHLEVAMWLHGLGLYRDRWLHEALLIAWNKRHLNVVKWLAVDAITMIHAYLFPLREFCAACENGLTQDAQWLYSNVPGIKSATGVHRAYHAESMARALFVACSQGRLSTAKWLLSIDAHGGNRDHVGNALRAAWWRGHLETAKWLSGQCVKVVMDVSDSDVEYVGSSGHLETARWLICREPDRVWSDRAVSHVRVWSPTRDAWMRAVAWSCHARKA